eukprot:TRINITY_DN9422_c0_g1_i1.p1 TRINITY_DN9422_c0_g1~~TRINITY_DN9422_c0_g1_i1.p1  ORF type:complete len:971 (-),score=166.80 TRINITY_DN9422_c0_g1_i1:150-3062(-)
MAPTSTANQKGPPDFKRRCQLLGFPYPRTTVNVKVMSFFLEGGSQSYCWDLNLTVETVLDQIKRSTVFRASPGLLGLDTQSGDASASQGAKLGLVIPPKKDTNQQDGIWLEASRPLWLYDLRDEDVLHMKEIPEEESSSLANNIPIRLIVPGEKKRATTVMIFNKISKVQALFDKMNSLRPHHRMDSKYYGAYLYDMSGGNWISENKSLDNYSEVDVMSIIELKRRPIFEFDLGTHPLLCDENTLVDQLIKMIACWISPPVDDPSVYGLLWLPAGKFSSLIWLMEDKPICSFGLKPDDLLEFKKKPTAVVDEMDTKPRVILSLKWTPYESYESQKKETTEVGPPRVAGEVLVHRFSKTVCYKYASVCTGEVLITNFSFIFSASPSENYDDLYTKIPLATISRVDKPNVVTSSPDIYFLDLYCKDLRVIRFGFNRNVVSRHVIVRIIEDMIYPKFTECFFAYFFDWEPPASHNGFNGWSLYDPIVDYDKQGIAPNLWRISLVNEKYECSETYPNKLIVPRSISDEELREVFPFRSKGRIPVLSYFHYNTATITRCSQPMVGISGARSYPDEKLVECILKANTCNNSRLYLFDARPKTNAIANQAMGYGFEGTGANQGYANCVLEFLGIDNIHHMRDSLMKLGVLCANSMVDDNNWLSGLENTRWLEHIKLMLSAAVRIAQKIDVEGASVLVHCSDGWDRTAQLTSLAQLFLNPYYRTLEGFELLIEKEWLSFGHRFQQRYGHGERNFMDDQRSPIFLQFIDCVWQVTQQFPCSFEFNERFLIAIIDALYSCQYGTFLFNCERERKAAATKTISLWTVVNASRENYVNPFYIPDNGIVYPSPAVGDLTLWKGYYFRWYRRKPSNPLTAELRGLQLKLMYEGMKQRVQELESKLSKAQSEINTLSLSSSSSSITLSPSPSVYGDHSRSPLVEKATSALAQQELEVSSPSSPLARASASVPLVSSGETTEQGKQ